MKKIFVAVYIVFLAVCLVLPGGCTGKTGRPAYRNASLPVEKRVDDLLRRMSIDEKLAQLQGSSDSTYIGDLGIGQIGFYGNGLAVRQSVEAYNQLQKYIVDHSRWGIPAFRSGEAIFSYMGVGSTCFPQPIAMASSFDPEVIHAMTDALGDEILSRGIHQVYAPVVNLARDVRWGRTGETYGEDPYLSARMGVSYVQTMEKKGIVTTPKHFVANMGLNGRFAGPVPFSEWYLRTFYFPAFKACFQEGGAESVMMAYNTINGVPCAMNTWLMNDVLRKEWGFKGFVVSDGGSLSIIQKNFGISDDKKIIAAHAINAGCDISTDDRGMFYGKPLKEAIDAGLVKEKTVDDAVRRFLTAKFRSGLFDHPFADPDEAVKQNDSPAHRALAEKIAEKCMVLLKNENHILPFSKKVKKVAVTGPLADWLLINHYGGWGQKRTTVLEGIRKLLPDAKVGYEKGAEMLSVALPAIPEKYFPGGLKGEYYRNNRLQGVPVYIRRDSKIAFDWKGGAPSGLPGDFFSVRWTGQLHAPVSGNVTFSLTVDDGGRLIINGDTLINEWQGGARRKVEAQYRLEKGKDYRVRVEYFDNHFTAAVQLGWDLDPDVNIHKAVDLVRRSDVAVVVVGMRDDENLDRADLDLDESQEHLISAVAATGKPMVVVIQTGTVITMQDWIDKVPALLMAWYPGEEGGTAIARTLFGYNNPGGKLPVTFPETTGQVPVNYNHLPGKPEDKYIDADNEPLFPFGYGLSYTTFRYADLHFPSGDTIHVGDTLQVAVDITNTGPVAGDEVAQLYVHDLYASISRPVKELKGFQRVSLKPGETKTVTFSIHPDDLSFYNANMQFVEEPGAFDIMVGSSSADIRLHHIAMVKLK